VLALVALAVVGLVVPLVVLAVVGLVVPLVVVALVVELLDLVVRLPLADRLLAGWLLPGRVDAGEPHPVVLAVGRGRRGRQRHTAHRERDRDQQADDPLPHSAPRTSGCYPTGQGVHPDQARL